MSATDLTLAVTVHDETAVSGPTMRSADLAVGTARAAGYILQTLIVLDDATATARDFFHQSRFDHWERRIYHEGDRGRLRNAVVPETDGRFIAFLDAVDLISENWLAGALNELDRRARDDGVVIAHPELNVVFDGEQSVVVNVGQESPLFTPHACYFRNYYTAVCVAPREAHLEVPHRAGKGANGIAAEDWHFAVETMARGWRHVVVPDTISFQRRTDSSHWPRALRRSRSCGLSRRC